MKKIKSVIIFAFSFIMIACNQATENKSAAQSPAPEQKQDATVSGASDNSAAAASQNTAEANNPVSNVEASYLNLKNALVKNDAKTARASAKTMLDEIAKAPMDKMSSEQHAVWMKYMKKLSFDAEHISETDDIDHHREHFASLSKNMYQVAKAFPTTSPVYYQFCPMADESKGAYWLSEQKEIHNPYYGDKMNGCPSTKETIQIN